MKNHLNGLVLKNALKKLKITLRKIVDLFQDGDLEMSN